MFVSMIEGVSTQSKEDLVCIWNSNSFSDF